ncbi:MAG: hypothetical protein PHV37_08990 [Candidatus Gastranaerophilales bacterium]|nr:hypothetical protein [Candidatus Gastranaerophilales bacterium]
MKLNWRNVESLVEPLEVDAITTQSGIYLRKDITESDGKYTYKEVLLSNDYRYDILDTEEYKAKLLDDFKILVQEENENTLAAKKTITTSIGDFSIKTPTYDFIFCLMALKDLPTGIPAGKLRLADGTAVPAMTQAQVQALYFEFTTLVAELDTKFVGYKTNINAAATIDALEQIEIVY